MMITVITTTITTAVIGGIFTFIFTRLNSKLDHIEEANKKRQSENVASREADRELLIATSKVTELIARKINDEGVNGELKDAEDELEQTRTAVQKITQHIFFEYMEGVDE